MATKTHEAIGRQLIRGRYQLPVAYLARCGAPNSARAGLLAEIARELPKNENALAMSYLHTATQLMKTGDDDSDQDQMLAAANLSAASHALGLKTASRSWSQKALRILGTTDLELTMHVQQREMSGTSLNGYLELVMSIDDPEAAARQQKQWMDYRNNWVNRLMSEQPVKATIGYELLKAAAVSAALNDIKRDSLPGRLIEWLDAQSQSGTKTSWKLPTAGLVQPRHIEMVSLTGRAKMRTGHVHEDHAKYNRLKSTKQWAAAAEHLQKLSKGNPAWQWTYFEVAAGSVSELGLEQTLEWMSKIQDTTTRMQFEVDAVRAASQGTAFLTSSRRQTHKHTAWFKT